MKFIGSFQLRAVHFGVITDLRRSFVDQMTVIMPILITGCCHHSQVDSSLAHILPIQPLHILQEYNTFNSVKGPKPLAMTMPLCACSTGLDSTRAARPDDGVLLGKACKGCSCAVAGIHPAFRSNHSRTPQTLKPTLFYQKPCLTQTCWGLRTYLNTHLHFHSLFT